MKESDNKQSYFQLLKQYVDDQLELAKISAAEQGGLLVGRMMLAGFILMMAMLFLVALGVLVVLLLGSPVYHYIDGVAYAMLLYVVMAILGWIFRTPIFLHPIANMIIRQIFNSGDSHTTQKEENA